MGMVLARGISLRPVDPGADRLLLCTGHAGVLGGAATGRLWGWPHSRLCSAPTCSCGFGTIGSIFEFLMIATAVLCDELRLVTWRWTGRPAQAHLQQPSAIALAIFSLGLLITPHADLPGVASRRQPRPASVRLFFLGSLRPVWWCSVRAVLRDAGHALGGRRAFPAEPGIHVRDPGVYYFVDATIPIAVFLGLHLLVTDRLRRREETWQGSIRGHMAPPCSACTRFLAGSACLRFTTSCSACLAPNLMAPWLDRASAAIEERLGCQRWNPPRSICVVESAASDFAYIALWIALFASMLVRAWWVARDTPVNPEFRWLAPARKDGREHVLQTWVRTMNVGVGHGSGRRLLSTRTGVRPGDHDPAGRRRSG